MPRPLGSVRSRITVVTTLVVAGALTLAAVLLLGLSRSTLVDDVRNTLTQDLLAAREQLNRGVVTELTLLELGQAVDPIEVSTELTNLECAPPLGEAYGTVPRPLSEFYQREGVSPLVVAEYEECVEETNPYAEAVARCETITIKSLGDPVMTFGEAQTLLSSPEFEAEVEACLDDSLRVDIRIEAAASLCDPRLEGVFADIDVLDRSALELRFKEVLDTYAACMRGNGVADYPDVALGSNEEGRSVLSGLAGAAIVLPSLETVQAGVDTFRIAILIGVPVLVLDVGMVAWFAVGRALRPVEAIRRRVTEIRGGSLDRRVPEPSADDEIGRLARTMNEMLERLERSSDRQRQFVSDASHELRSPIASMRTQLEVAAAHPAGADWPDLVAGVLEETSRMERLVDDLLALARADEGVMLRRIEEVDLGEVVLSESQRIDGIEVITDDIRPAPIRGDGLAIRRLVRNLLENASRHASSVVEVRVTAGAGEATFEVDDDGAGIAPADRERVFERFTRLEEARSRDAGGSGLGLAVVREIAAAHSGSVSVADGRRGGARFVVRLPTEG